MKKALIQGTQVCDVVAIGDEFPVHPDLVWVDVADTTTTHDTYVDGAVVSYVEYVLTPQDVIDRLENSITNRTLRGAALGDATSISMLTAKEDLIAIERAKL